MVGWNTASPHCAYPKQERECLSRLCKPSRLANCTTSQNLSGPGGAYFMQRQERGSGNVVLLKFTYRVLPSLPKNHREHPVTNYPAVLNLIAPDVELCFIKAINLNHQQDSLWFQWVESTYMFRRFSWSQLQSPVLALGIGPKLCGRRSRVPRWVASFWRYWWVKPVPTALGAGSLDWRNYQQKPQDHLVLHHTPSSPLSSKE
jgi:hypothetical protein